MRDPTTTYELHVGDKKIAQWTDVRRKGPPPKMFVMIPRQILDHPELKDYSSRAAVINSAEVESGYLVKVEAIRLTSSEATLG